ncbi:MAG: DUF1549 domain-containing protein, partial [Planctomycetaceae bacterium]|nr:DUF1549 domain-containing protein [Planctomycetaceae bacterium]
MAWPRALPLLALGLLVTAGDLPLAADEPPDFERDVAPTVVNHCLVCHQPLKRSGGLDLSTLATAMAGGELGPAIVAGKPAESVLVDRITAGEMPPPKAKESKKLSAQQIDMLRRWVASGAAWPNDRALGVHEKSVDLDQARSFWSFQPVRRPDVPIAPSHKANPIDAFIAARLSAADLALSPPAEPLVLLRRLSLDLRGFPPTIAEQDAFLTCSRSEREEETERPRDRELMTYEAVVDRFLSDPAYGERWARHWLDLVRYADSNGYERDDAKPSVWRYRDYVIAALNSDKPYDRFVLEQIAGDELPDASDETLIATGFHALGPW